MFPSFIGSDSQVRIWRDERLNLAWRVAYRDGDGETVVTFPDRDALDDFLSEVFGLELDEPLHPELA